MPGRVAVVTDSTAYLPADLVNEHGIAVVPLQVILDGKPFAEGAELSGHDIAEALRHSRVVSTSRVSPGQLLAVYADVAARGATEIVSVHLSAELSGTCDSALLAAAEATVPVHVVDSRSLGMALGFAVLEAASAAASGADGRAAAAAARRRAERSSTMFYVDTLEHLRRGGRVTNTRAFIGTALAVKPLLEVADGRIRPLENVRTAGRALARLEELSVERAGSEPVDLAVHHLDSPTRASVLAERLVAHLPAARRVLVSEIGPVIGAHVGPGLVAVVISPVLVP